MQTAPFTLPKGRGILTKEGQMANQRELNSLSVACCKQKRIVLLQANLGQRKSHSHYIL